MAPVLFLAAFAITYVLIPKILWVVRSLELMDTPGHRSSHQKPVPTMAGIAFFITLIFSVFFIQSWDSEGVSLHLIAALTVIFVIGFKDDLVVSTARAKFGGQVLAVIIVLWSGLYHNINMEGFLGLYQLPIGVSYLILMFIMLAIINAINLLDGIDGLIGLLGIVIFTTFAVIFFTMGVDFYALLSLSLIGILVAFLRFNFSTKQKIFMGDTGSLVIGFCIGFLTIKFLTMETTSFGFNSFHAHDKLMITLIILYLPFLDTTRVIGIRLLQGKSPFNPDRNHIHHLLIDAGLTHKKASLLLGSGNLLLVTFFLFLSTHLESGSLFLIFIASYILLLVVFYVLRLKIYKNRKVLNALKRLYIVLRIKNKRIK